MGLGDMMQLPIFQKVVLVGLYATLIASWVFIGYILWKSRKPRTKEESDNQQ